MKFDFDLEEDEDRSRVRVSSHCHLDRKKGCLRTMMTEMGKIVLVVSESQSNIEIDQ
jgi:hypothetical protein